MTYSSYIAGSNETYISLEDFMERALVPALKNAFKSGLIDLLPNDKARYKNFIQSGIWARHLCKTKEQENIRNDLQLILKVIVGDAEIQTVTITRKGDNLITLAYMVDYNIGPDQIDTCDSVPIFDKEELTDNCWERYLIYYPSEPVDVNKKVEGIDKLLEDLKSRKNKIT